MARKRAYLSGSGLELELFEESCTVIMANESEDVPLDTFLKGKRKALEHFIKLMPYRVEIVGKLATLPEEWNSQHIFGGPNPRPLDKFETLRQMANARDTFIYVSPSYDAPNYYFENMLIEEAVCTANNREHNVYDVRIQMKNVVFFDSWEEFWKGASNIPQTFGNVLATTGPWLTAGGAVIGGVIGAVVGGQLGAAVGAVLGGAAGLAAAVTVSAVVALGAFAIKTVVSGVQLFLQWIGALPAQRGSLPWQKFTTPLGWRGNYEFEIYPHLKGFPVITVRKGDYTIVENKPIRLGENVLAEVQYDDYAKGLYLVAAPVVEGISEVTNDNFGDTTQLFVFSVDEGNPPSDIPVIVVENGEIVGVERNNAAN